MHIEEISRVVDVMYSADGRFRVVARIETWWLHSPDTFGRLLPSKSQNPIEVLMSFTVLHCVDIGVDVCAGLIY